jgi:hypothetical protein
LVYPYEGTGTEGTGNGVGTEGTEERINTNPFLRPPPFLQSNSRFATVCSGPTLPETMSARE